MYSKHHPINTLKEQKSHFSQLLLNILSYGELYKDGVDYLYKEITNNLLSAGIEIGESDKQKLQGISDNLASGWHYKANSDEFKFVVNFIRDIEMKILQKTQEAVQNRKDTMKLGKGSKLFACITDRQDYKDYNKEKKELKSDKHKFKIEEWKIKLDQKFEESKGKQIDKIAKEIGSSYIKRATKENHYNNNYCHYKIKSGYKQLEFRSLEEILDRANPTYKDKQILLKWDIHQVKTLLEDKEKNLTKGDRKALKEIYQDLKKEKDESKKDFDSKSDRYIKESRETRSVPPQSIIEGVPIVTSRPDLSTTLHL
jgi:hypothetical protein